MSVGFLSSRQAARYGRFVEDVSPGELEQFFRLDAAALELASAKRREHNKVGWAVQWGTVRMLGTFLADPTDVPTRVMEFVAEQLGVDDPGCFKACGQRLPTQHEHAREIRHALGYREFAEGEEQLRQFVAARAWSQVEGPRALFDRAVLWLIEHRVLLPGITVLGELVSGVRAEETRRLYAALHGAASPELRRRLLDLLTVPDGKRTSQLEELRRGPTKVNGREMERALDRAAEVQQVGAGEADVSYVPEAKLAALARYGVSAKAGVLEDLSLPRRTGTLLAAVRQLGTTSVDDALDLFDVLMATKLLARAERASVADKLRTLPKFRRAAKTLSAAVEVLLETPPGQQPPDSSRRTATPTRTPARARSASGRYGQRSTKSSPVTSWPPRSSWSTRWFPTRTMMRRGGVASWCGATPRCARFCSC